MPENDPDSGDTSNRLRSESASSSERGADEHTSQQPEDWLDDWQLVPEKVRVDARQAAVGGALAAVVSLVGAWLVGQTSGAEARMLLETSLTTTRSFCGTLTLALGNILALMLTLLSLSASTDIDLEWAHYQRVKQIAWVVTVSVIGATLIYLLLNVPLVQSDKAADPTTPGYEALYYATLILSSLLAGAFITVVLMLYNTLRDIIRVIGPKEFGHWMRSEEERSNEG